VFLSLYILFVSKGKQGVLVDKSIVYLNLSLGAMIVLQLLMGTQVRGQIDNIVEHLGYVNRSGWVALLNNWFYIHRSFSLLIALMAIFINLKCKVYPLANKLSSRVLKVVVVEILVGATLAYAGFPEAGQPLHLLLSSVLIALVFDNMLKLKVRPS
jgi:cytochrome c oxidase assembly protein subunit 15